MADLTRMHTAYLAIGANVNAEANIVQIVAALRQSCAVVATSAVYESTDTDGGGSLYLNAAVIVQTHLTPEALKIEVLRPIEARLGRQAGCRAVPADVDLVLYDTDILNYLGKSVPHADVLTKAHVLIPLAEIAPEYVHPVSGRTLGSHAQSLPTGGLRPRQDLNLP